MRVGKLKINFIVFVVIITQFFLLSGIHIANAVSSESEIETLIQNLNASDVNVKADSVKSLVEIGEHAVEPLIQALGAEDPDLRENAAVTLGKIKDERAVQPLIGLLTDEEWEVESAATNALVAIGKPAVEPLIEILQDENEDTFLQTKVIAVLAGIKDERAIQPMIQALKEKPELQADLGYHLGLMGEPAVETLIKALGDEDPEARVRAAEALGRIGGERAVGPLTDALNDEDEGVRLFAKMGLESIGNQQNNTLIMTYGKEREFYIEDQRREWYDQLDTICNLARNNMESYLYPEGPVISYGWGIENCVGVGILEGSEVNSSTLDNIYDTLDRMGKKIGVNDVPVVFRYEEFAQEDEGTIQEAAEEIEETQETVKNEEAGEAEGTKETEESAENMQKSKSIPGFESMFALLCALTTALYANKS